MEKRLGTLTLGVRDLARARAFYEQGLGWTRDGGESDIAFYQLNGIVLGSMSGPSSRSMPASIKPAAAFAA